MTPARLRECLALLRWSQLGLADILGYDPRLVRRWASGARPVPPDVAAWIERAAAFHAPLWAAMDAWRAGNPAPR